MRVFLTGFMAAGKTAVGRLVAERFDVPFLDLDSAIEERAGLSVPEIFSRHGEGAFRRLELETLEAVCEALDLERAVVATGGGTVTIPGSREIMRDGGVLVWLDPPFEVIAERLRATEASTPSASATITTRPLYRDEDQARALFEQRLSAYGRADVRVAVSAGERPAQVASRVVEAVNTLTNDMRKAH